MDDEIGEDCNFLCTQMQSAYDQDTANRELQKKISQSVSKLHEFTASDANIAKPKQKKLAVKKPIRKPKPTTKRIKTITSHVNEIFGDSKETKPSQHSILAYFSGRKRKVKEILSKLNDMEDSMDSTPSNFNFGNNKLPYNKTEWQEILMSIRKSLPNLSSSATKTLKLITDNIELENSQPEDLWSKASRHPSNDLTTNDLKLLYNLRSDSGIGQESLVVAQGVRTGSGDLSLDAESPIDNESHRSDDEIEKSVNDIEPNEKPYDVYEINSDTNETYDKQDCTLIHSEEEIPDSSSEPELLDYKVISSHQKQESNILGSNTLSIMEPSSPVQQVESPKFKTPTKISPKKISPSKVIDLSPIKFSPIKRSPVRRSVESSGRSPVRSPVKRSPGRFQVKSSQVASQYSDLEFMHSQRSQGLQSNGSPMNNGIGSLYNGTIGSESQSNGMDLDLDGGTDSAYATATSQFDNHRTKIIEVSKQFNVNNLIKENYQIRKIGERSRSMNENEIQDSEGEEGDISLIEITYFDNHSVIQVPSSPGVDTRESRDFEKEPGTKDPGTKDPETGPEPREPEIEDSEDDSQTNAIVLKQLKQYTNKEIKEIFTKLELKPRKSKKEMFEVLKRVNDLIEPVTSEVDSDSQFLTFPSTQMSPIKGSPIRGSPIKGSQRSPSKGSQSPVKASQKASQSQINDTNIFSTMMSNLSQITQTEFTKTIYDQIKTKIQSDDIWNEKVISFEPIQLKNLKNWLDSEGLTVENEILEKFCDYSGICTVNPETAGSFRS